MMLKQECIVKDRHVELKLGSGSFLDILLIIFDIVQEYLHSCLLHTLM